MGRRKKEFVEIEKDITIEEALDSVKNLIHKIARKYKTFCNHIISYEDIVREAEIGAIEAYKRWNPNKNKFITYAYNQIERRVTRYIEEMSPQYRQFVYVKTNMRNKGKSFNYFKEQKKTDDEEFNKMYNLDGKREFTKELYDEYTRYVLKKMMKTDSFSITPASHFQTQENDEIDDIFDLVGVEDNYDYDVALINDEFVKNVATKLINGYKIGEIANLYGMRRNQLIRELEKRGIEV
jgi:DNA-directed RNA polymerase specialized sigma subunit